MAVAAFGPARAKRTIVCLHGLTANRSTWLPVAERLQGDRRVFLVDLLGRGESAPSLTASYGLEAEAERLAALLRSLGAHQPLLAGHSHGAAIAVAAANRVQACGLLLVNPVTPDLSRPLALEALRIRSVRQSASLAARLFRRPLTRYMLVRRVFAHRGAIPAGAIPRYAEPWGDPNRAAVLPRVLQDWNPAELERWAAPPGIPVAVIAGSADRRIRPEMVRRWADRLGGTFYLARNSGHAVPEEKPDEVTQVLQDLLETIDTREQEETLG
jgi:pimeloyl-ACP methyl ester carboxylesterase